TAQDLALRCPGISGQSIPVQLGIMVVSAAEMSFNERPSEHFLLLTTHGANLGIFNLSMYSAFAAVKGSNRFRFIIRDWSNPERKRVAELTAPEEASEIATLVRDPARYVVQSIYLPAGEPAAVLGTIRPSDFVNGGRAIGPVLLVRTQSEF